MHQFGSSTINYNNKHIQRQTYKRPDPETIIDNHHTNDHPGQDSNPSPPHCSVEHPTCLTATPRRLLNYGSSKHKINLPFIGSDLQYVWSYRLLHK